MHMQSSQEEYEVQEIRQEKFFNGKPYYLIKWKGFPENQCTWQPIENMENSLTYLIEWKKQKLIDFEKQKNRKVSPRANSFLQERQCNYVKSSKSSREKPWKNLLGIQKQNQAYDENGQEKTKRKLKRLAQDSNDEQLNLEKWKIHKIPKQNQEAVVKLQANSSNRSKPINEHKKQEDKTMKKDKFVKIEQLSPEKKSLQIQLIDKTPTKIIQRQIQKPLQQQQQQQQLEGHQEIMLNRSSQCIIQEQNHGNPKQVYYCQKQKQITQQFKEQQKIGQCLQQNEQLIFNDDTTKINSHLNQNSLVSSLKPDNIQQASTAIRQVELSPINQLDQFKQVQQERPTNEIIAPLKDIQIIQNPQQISVERISKTIFICSRKYFQVQLSNGKTVLLSHENTKKNFPIKLCDYYELFVIDVPSTEAEEPML